MNAGPILRTRRLEKVPALIGSSDAPPRLPTCAGSSWARMGRERHNRIGTSRIVLPSISRGRRAVEVTAFQAGVAAAALSGCPWQPRPKWGGQSWPQPPFRRRFLFPRPPIRRSLAALLALTGKPEAAPTSASPEDRGESPDFHCTPCLISPPALPLR